MAYIPRKRAPLKNRLESKLLQYLSNPDNPVLTRTELAIQVLGYKDNKALYVHFNSGELTEIENQALQIRRSKYAKPLMKVDAGILKSGASGNSKSAKLCYQRFENWSEKKTIEGVITFEAVLRKAIGSSSGPDVIDVTPDDKE